MSTLYWCSVCGKSLASPCALHSSTAVMTQREVLVPSPRGFGPCPKCGWTDVGVTWHGETAILSSCGRWACPGRAEEHLLCTCRRCQYAWAEPVDEDIGADIGAETA